MFDEQARQLLDRPGLLGVVCTCRPDGSPRANPVWFRRSGEQLRVWTDEARRWVENLRREPRVAFSVHENVSPWASLSIRAHAELVELASGEVRAEIRAICARYLPAGKIDAYVEQWPQTRSIVALQPTSAFGAQAFEDPVADRRQRSSH
jgi:PPOX class probable F420-dependent enzyme